MEGGKNGMALYSEVTIEKHALAALEKAAWAINGNTATIEKHSFDIAKKRLGDEGNTATIDKDSFAIAGEGNTLSIGKGIIVEIGRRNGQVPDYAKKRREQYDKPPEDPPPWDNTVSPLYSADKIPHPLDPFR